MIRRAHHWCCSRMQLPLELWHIRPVSDKNMVNIVVCSIVCIRLSYFNSIFYEFSEFNVNRLQRIQNALAHVVCAAPYKSPAIHLPQSLHLLPTRQYIHLKFGYTVNLCTSLTYNSPSQSLHSQGKDLLGFHGARCKLLQGHSGMRLQAYRMIC